MAERPRLATTRGDAGDIFVESMVAAAIVAMIMVATFRVVTDAATHARMNEQRRVALLVAKSELAEVGSQIPIASGDSSGVSGDMVWRVQVSPYSDESGASTVGALWRVDVSVRSRLERRDLIRLRTLRLGPEA
jgi:type II secretory pathway pseudopilin PulG